MGWSGKTYWRMESRAGFDVRTVGEIEKWVLGNESRGETGNVAGVESGCWSRLGMFFGLTCLIYFFSFECCKANLVSCVETDSKWLFHADDLCNLRLVCKRMNYEMKFWKLQVWNLLRRMVRFAELTMNEALFMKFQRMHFASRQTWMFLLLVQSLRMQPEQLLNMREREKIGVADVLDFL